MKIVAIIQARMTSTRLPGKVLMPIGDKPLIQILLERIKRSKHIDEIVVALPQDTKSEPLETLCQQLGVSIFRGSELDVLTRFTGAARAHQADVVVRLCSDCPFLDPSLTDQVIKKFLDGDFDYVNNIGARSFPDGLDVEVFTAESLYQADRTATHPKHREHVTTYIDGRVAGLDHGKFRCASLDNDVSYGHLMWSVNTQEHLDHCRALYALQDNKESFTWKELLQAEEQLQKQ